MKIQLELPVEAVNVVLLALQNLQSGVANTIAHITSQLPTGQPPEAPTQGESS